MLVLGRVKELAPIDLAQILNYLKITDLQIGLLINFNVMKLTDGIRRVANRFAEKKTAPGETHPTVRKDAKLLNEDGLQAASAKHFLFAISAALCEFSAVD